MQQPLGTASSAPPSPQGRVIVDQRFCSPNPVDLNMTSLVGNYIIKDGNENRLFEVKRGSGFVPKRILLDDSGSPILTMKMKFWSYHNGWEVFRGDSTNERDRIYTVKKSTLPRTQLKGKFDVFVDPNTGWWRTCDFRIKERWLDRSCVVYSGESDAIVAQMHQNDMMARVLHGHTNYSVRINPNADHAFIASLVVILDWIHWTPKVASFYIFIICILFYFFIAPC
ncbi:hypothetical protein HA466_0203830 [Hirschfeldia incana]|nr:hypothetical protein HA466_0203830 [Hirschfeldia incana]